MKKKILIIAGYYTPSIKGGGPIQSIKNIVDNLYNDFDFYIIANDRDLGDDKSFENIRLNDWVSVGNATVYYTDIEKLKIKNLIKIINDAHCDILYLNSVFSFKLSILPLLFAKTKKIIFNKIVVAPRGGFSQGALILKSQKKSLFLKVAKLIYLYKGIVWHATAIDEKNDIISNLGNNNNIIVSSNLTENYNDITYNKDLKKEPGKLKISFISRIHPKKNVMLAIEILEQVRGNVEFNIYGPIEDKEYWGKCNILIKNMPSNVKISYKGILEHNDIRSMFNKHHILLFPTLGENFGHVISEALIGGCPVIISDQTPWKNLEDKGIGWDISLKNKTELRKSVQKCIDWDQKTYNAYSKKAFEYAKMKSNQEKDIANIISLLT